MYLKNQMSIINFKSLNFQKFGKELTLYEAIILKLGCSPVYR